MVTIQKRTVIIDSGNTFQGYVNTKLQIESSCANAVRKW